MKILFTKQAEEYLEKQYTKKKKKLNLVLRAKQIDKNCYAKLEPAVDFETDEDYLEGIEKISDWGSKINIFLDPVIEQLLENKDEVKIDLQGKFFKNLKVLDGKTLTKLGSCAVTFKRPQF
ncbi:MAG: hypothetical protein ACTSRG_25505 [Candidatus Helarchaeota archaeon]